MDKSATKREVPESCNLTHPRWTSPNPYSTYRIGLCGFRIQGSRQLAASLSEAVQAAFDTANAGRLLLLPGRWKRRNPWPNVDEIAAIASDAKLPILFETTEGEWPLYTAVSDRGKRLPLRLYQRFANCKEAKPEAVQKLANDCNMTGIRVVHLGGVTLGVLICGENNIIANRQDNKNEAYVRHGIAPNLFRDVRLIFNGAHSKMGEWGKLDRRFEFLSAEKRWFFFAANNVGRTWGSSTLRVYYNGQKVATSAGLDNRNATNGGKSWNVTLSGQRHPICATIASSNDDRCKLLTLDIPAKLLR
jgi:hypothetical protein